MSKKSINSLRIIILERGGRVGSLAVRYLDKIEKENDWDSTDSIVRLKRLGFVGGQIYSL